MCEECIFIKYLKYLITFSLKNWNWTVVFLLFVWWIILNQKTGDPSLILGGIILILMAINYSLYKDKLNPGIIAIFLMASLGVLSIIVDILLPLSIDAFALSFLFLAFVNLAISYFFRSKKDILFIVYSIAIYTLLVVFNLGIISGAANYLIGVNKETLSLISYLLILGIFSFTFITLFIWVERFFDLVKFLSIQTNSRSSKGYANKKYVSLIISIILFVLIGGYYYLKVKSDDVFRDFLVIITWAFFSSFFVVSALKNIFDK